MGRMGQALLSQRSQRRIQHAGFNLGIEACRNNRQIKHDPQQPVEEFYQRVPHRNRVPTETTATRQDQPAENRNIINRQDPAFAVRTRRWGMIQTAQLIPKAFMLWNAVNADVQKTADDSPKHKQPGQYNRKRNVAGNHERISPRYSRGSCGMIRWTRDSSDDPSACTVIVAQA